MNAGSLAAVRQLVRDTFRQACASGVCWMMLAVTAICVLLCLSVKVTGDTTLQAADEPGYFRRSPAPQLVAPSVTRLLGSSNPLDVVALTAASVIPVRGTPSGTWTTENLELARHEGIEIIGGRMTLAFGAVSFPLARERGDSVRFLELLLAGGIAGTLGVLLALVWTAGFMPTFLEPSSAAVLLAKPAPRWQLLLGKYCGVLIFVGFQVVLLVILTWLALGLRTGVWDITYWWCIPMLMLQFTIFYSFSALLAVVTRSTVACVFGAVLFWLLSWGINYGRVAAHGTLEAPQLLPSFTLALADAAYWISPKPIDAAVILFNALDAQHHFDKPALFKLVEAGQFSPALSTLSCLIITGLLLGLAAYEFKELDY